jgi:hypothetical protein
MRLASDSLTESHLLAHPVWEFAIHDSTADDGDVEPVDSLPVADLDNRIVGTQVRLANGETCWALLQCVDLQNPRATRQFLSLVLKHHGDWFALDRYYDKNEARGPDALARFVGLPIDDVFPIAYDLRGIAIGHPDALVGTIEKEPRERLSFDERLALMMERNPPSSGST